MPFWPDDFDIPTIKGGGAGTAEAGGCVLIAGESGTAYKRRDADIGFKIFWRRRSSNSLGSVLATGVGTGVTQPAPPPNNCDSVNDGFLKYYFRMDEAAGANAIDSKAGVHTGIDNLIVTTQPGVIGTSRTFSSVAANFFSIADHIDLSPGAGDFALSLWAAASGAGGAPGLLIKGETAGQREYGLYLDNTENRYKFYVSDNGTALQTVVANSFGAPTFGLWQFINIWRDSTLQTLNIQVNNTAVDSIAHTTGIFDGTEPLLIGKNPLTGNWNGNIDEVAYAKGRIWTAAERTSRFNSGLGCRPTGL